MKKSVCRACVGILEDERMHTFMYTYSICIYTHTRTINMFCPN